VAGVGSLLMTTPSTTPFLWHNQAGRESARKRASERGSCVTSWRERASTGISISGFDKACLSLALPEGGGGGGTGLG